VHVLHDAEDRDAGATRGVDGARYRARRLVRGDGDGDGTGDRRDDQREIGETRRIGREIDDQRIELAPADVADELSQHTGFSGAAPHVRLADVRCETECRAVVEHQVRRDHANAIASDRGLYPVVTDHERSAFCPEQPSDGGTLQIRVDDAYLQRTPRKGDREGRAHPALSHAALATHDDDHAIHARESRRDPSPLLRDLLAQAGPILARDFVVGPEGHRSHAARASIHRFTTTTTMAMM